MIDNPEPDQVMSEKEQINLQRNFEDHCYKQAKEICEQNDVHTDCGTPTMLLGALERL